MLNNCIQVILAALEAKDNGLLPHSITTAQISAVIGQKVQALNTMKVEEMYISGLLHDVGKLYITDAILEKRSSLSKKEWEAIHYHAFWGHKLLTQVDCLAVFANIALHHHEAPDGSGYPQGLKLEEIRPIVRVVNIADRFAAMMEDRPYRRTVPATAAIKILEKDIYTFFGQNDGQKIIYELLKPDVGIGYKLPGLKKLRV